MRKRSIFKAPPKPPPVHPPRKTSPVVAVVILLGLGAGAYLFLSTPPAPKPLPPVRTTPVQTSPLTLPVQPTPLPQTAEAKLPTPASPGKGPEVLPPPAEPSPAGEDRAARLCDPFAQAAKLKKKKEQERAGDLPPPPPLPAPPQVPLPPLPEEAPQEDPFEGLEVSVLAVTDGATPTALVRVGGKVHEVVAGNAISLDNKTLKVLTVNAKEGYVELAMGSAKNKRRFKL